MDLRRGRKQEQRRGRHRARRKGEETGGERQRAGRPPPAATRVERDGEDESGSATVTRDTSVDEGGAVDPYRIWKREAAPVRSR
jgi:hypothetical protein